MVTDALPGDTPIGPGNGSTGQAIVSEVYFRIGGQMPRTDSSGNGTSGTVLYYVNEALGLLAGSATFAWDVIVTRITIPTNGMYDLSGLSNPIDLGGHIELANDNGIPITRVDDERVLGVNSAQYINYNPTVFNQWYIVGPSPGLLLMKPGLPVPTEIRLSYKALPPTLLDSTTTRVRWTNPWVDGLLIDFAEMEISRILGFGGVEMLSARCLSKLKDARAMFTMQRKETGPPDEVDAGAKGA